MGIASDNYGCIRLAIKTLLEDSLMGICPNQIKMLEFGAQGLRNKTFDKDHEVGRFLESIDKLQEGKCVNAKLFFESIGVDHTSVDINGEFDSEYMDLSKIQNKWKNEFDIVTNFGTIEHVFHGQYESFLNCHNFTKPRGIMIHCVPMKGRVQLRHPISRTVYRGRYFFYRLADALGYDILSHCVLKRGKKKGGDLLCTLRKTGDTEFISRDMFDELE